MTLNQFEKLVSSVRHGNRLLNIVEGPEALNEKAKSIVAAEIIMTIRSGNPMDKSEFM